MFVIMYHRRIILAYLLYGLYYIITGSTLFKLSIVLVLHVLQIIVTRIF